MTKPKTTTTKVHVAPAQPEQSVLHDAYTIVHEQRSGTYGSPSSNMAAIALMWTAYMRARFGMTLPDVKATDVCAMMRLVKESRLICSPDHRDSLVDIAGYVAVQEQVLAGG